jgi:hypothetical protein
MTSTASRVTGSSTISCSSGPERIDQRHGIVEPWVAQCRVGHATVQRLEGLSASGPHRILVPLPSTRPTPTPTPLPADPKVTLVDDGHKG